MADGCGFGGVKAYKDSKLALAMTARLLYKQYKTCGVVFSCVDPGCVADTPLFREEVPGFQQYLPVGVLDDGLWTLLRNRLGGGGYLTLG